MKIILTLILLFFQFGIQGFTPSNENYVKSSLIPNDQIEDGLKLLTKHCYTCHDPKSKSHDEIIAPPLWGVKKHYLDAFPEKEQFSKAMMEFILNPNEENAIMKGPIKRFGLMPKPVVSEEEARQIIAYIYETEIENPAWPRVRGISHMAKLHCGD